MSRPRLLDLFCGAGGAAMGYHRAGFDIVGVDLHPQPHYPFEFRCADALHELDLLTSGCPMIGGWYLRAFDAIHASPPCQDHMRTPHGKHGTGWLLPATRELLKATGLPWVIENVPGADMRVDYALCGCQFGFRHLRRERWFETSWQGFGMRLSHNHTEVASRLVCAWCQGPLTRPRLATGRAL